MTEPADTIPHVSNDDCYEQGQAAYISGTELESCPWPDGSAERDYWMTGWECAETLSKRQAEADAIVECWANGPRNAIRPGHELPETLAKERKEAADESELA